jgi:DNA-directed RNA polymerase specialized sigma54-like protein
MTPIIIDIAKMTNTSKSTVSRYLNGGWHGKEGGPFQSKAGVNS